MSGKPWPICAAKHGFAIINERAAAGRGKEIGLERSPAEEFFRTLYILTLAHVPVRLDSTAASMTHIISWPVRKSGKAAL
jgi:hypothetical protein